MMNALIEKNELRKACLLSSDSWEGRKDFPFPESVPGIVAFTSQMEILDNPDFETGIAYHHSRFEMETKRHKIH